METIALTEAVYYILLSLTEPLHGYGIMQKVEELTRGRLLLAAGTLYGALSSLLDKGWITLLSEGQDSRRKEYQISPEGKRILQQEWLRLWELVENGKQLLGDKREA